MKILSLEQALTEGKETAYPKMDNEYDYDLTLNRAVYRDVIKQMYRMKMVVGVKYEN